MLTQQFGERLHWQLPAYAGVRRGCRPDSLLRLQRHPLQPGILPDIPPQRRGRAAPEPPQTHSYRGVVGTRGDLSSAFSYDAYYQYGKTNYTQVYKNEFSAARLFRSVNVVSDPRAGPGFGQPVCRSVLDGSDPNCVPFNYFGVPFQRPQGQYLNVFGVIEGNTSEQIANVNFTGALGELGPDQPVGDRRRRHQRRLGVSQGIADP